MLGMVGKNEEGKSGSRSMDWEDGREERVFLWRECGTGILRKEILQRRILPVVPEEC